MKSLMNQGQFLKSSSYLILIINVTPLLAQSECVINNIPFNYSLTTKNEYTVAFCHISSIKPIDYHCLKSSTTQLNKSQKMGKTLSYIGGGLLLSSVFINYADRQTGKAVFFSGVAISPLALFFAINGRARKNHVPKTSMAYTEKPLIE